MKFLEKDLETIIYENLQTDKGKDLLFDKGLEIDFTRLCLAKRQLYIGNYGTADIVILQSHFYYPHENEILENKCINVIELKKENINIDTLLQAVKYVKGIKTYLRNKTNYDSSEYDYNITLIGKNIDISGNWVYLFDVFELINVTIYKYKYKIDGLFFEEVFLDEYNLINSGFDKELPF
jgi:hypothetical protein